MLKQYQLRSIFVKRSVWVLIFSVLFLAVGLSSVSAGVGPYTGRIALGQDHTCILQYDQSVDCYGWDHRGQSTDHPGPLRDIVSGTFHNCGLLPDDTAVCWGDGRNGELEVPTGAFQQIAAGDGFTCGLRPTGMVECWGKNNLGQAIPAEGPFDRIELGSSHGCGFHDDDGSMDCWGYDRDGRTMDVPAGDYLDQSVGLAHNCVLLADGSADCWGYNLWGQAEDHPGPFVQIEPGWGHTCALDANGDVTCWGNNSGNVPGNIPGPFVQIFAGGNHYCGIRPNETFECWGYNYYGQGDTNEQPFGEEPEPECVVLALEGSPYDGPATIVQTKHGRFNAIVWKHQQGLPPDTCFEIHGTNGNDSIFGAFADDTIYGYGGNDKLYGRSGNDILIGGDGNDFLFGDLGFYDELYGEAGHDRLTDGDGVAAAHGGSGHDHINLFFWKGWTSPNGDASIDGLISGGYDNDNVSVVLLDRSQTYDVNISGDEFDDTAVPDEGNHDKLILWGNITADSEIIKFEKVHLK